MSGSRRNGFTDPVEDQVEIAEDKLVREAQNGKALALQPSIALRVTRPTRLGFVRFAVQLDDHACGGTEEIRDVGPDRHLPPELQATKAPAAHLLPEGVLGPRVGLPLLPGEGAQARIRRVETPTLLCRA
jgi:hypothetical protein